MAKFSHCFFGFDCWRYAFSLRKILDRSAGSTDVDNFEI